MDVFISYSSKSGDLAELVKLKLEKENLVVWKDTSHIDAGTEWRHDQSDKYHKNKGKNIMSYLFMTL